MILTQKQISSVAFGATEIYFDKASAHFYRIRKEQCERIDDYNADFGMKSRATAGVRLDFYTDSEFFGFSYTLKNGSSRTFYNFALYIDGKEYALHGESHVKNFAGEYATALPAGNKRVTLFLPCLFATTLTSVTLSDGAHVTPYSPKKRIVFHGDSITHGYDAFSPALCYANRLAMAFHAEIFNYAIAGETFNPLMVDEANAREANAVVIAYGTNDWKKKPSLSALISDCEAFYAKLRGVYPATPFVAILPIWRDGYETDTAVGSFQTVRAELARIAQKYGATVIDLWDTIPHDLAFFSDGLHPNDEGFALYAKGVQPTLSAILEDK